MKNKFHIIFHNFEYIVLSTDLPQLNETFYNAKTQELLTFTEDHTQHENVQHYYSIIERCDNIDDAAAAMFEAGCPEAVVNAFRNWYSKVHFKLLYSLKPEQLKELFFKSNPNNHVRT